MFRIVPIPADAPEATEPLGTKDKFWFSDHRYLFKKARPGTGEDWAEKIAEQVAAFLTLPHAAYELADWETDSGVERGVISRNFCERDAALVLGNEFLAEADPDYAVGAISKFHVPAHTVERVVYTLRHREPGLPLDWDPPAYVENACDTFIGYLLLDAVVGNTDRHHENWGFIRTAAGQFHLAPTFDASSLGRNLRDDDRARRLWTRDRNSDVAAFSRRARSALFRHQADARALPTSEAFREAAHLSPRAALGWLERLTLMADADIGTIVGNVPQDRISATAAEFARTVMCQNRLRLLAMREDLQ